MQKFLAIFAALALIATGAFAVDISAGGGATVEVLRGDTAELPDGVDREIMTSAVDAWFWLGAEKVNDDNTAGAKLGLGISRGDVMGFDNDGDPEFKSQMKVSPSLGDTWFYAWWYPMEQIFLKMGKVGEDGKYFAGAGIMGWDFQSNDLLISPGLNYYNGFAGGLLPDGFAYFGGIYGDRALQLSILPMDGFAINFGWAFDDEIVAALIDNLSVQFVYDIPGAGQAALGFVNANADDVKDNGAERNLYVQYKHPLGDMKIEGGIHIPLGDELNRINVGIGFGYGSPWGDQFWLNARVGVQIALQDYVPTIIGVDICPSYDLGMFRFYCPVGFAVWLPPGGDGDTLVGWSFNPYIRKDLGGVEFWTGFMLYNGNGSYWNQASLQDKGNEQINYAFKLGFLWAW